MSEMVAETSEASKDQQSESATSESSCFANLSERDLEKILEDKLSNKTKKDTNWSVSTFKGEFQTEIVIFFLYMIKNKHMKCYIFFLYRMWKVNIHHVNQCN